ncbi:hypothetical protein B6U96_14595 [Archaeoglobales archaeon ex4484_92]|nr:MAG: hypothetical protein B6U96_14595 [Archaeoglobales archaeon ex4484_92]
MRTRIYAHFIDASPAEGEETGVEGGLQFYDVAGRSWKPLVGDLHFFVDGRKIGVARTDGYGKFLFKFRAFGLGKHKFEIRYSGGRDYEPSTKSLEFKVVRKEEKSRLMILARNVAISFILLVVFLILVIFIVKILL